MTVSSSVRHAMRAVIRDEEGIALGFVPVPLAGPGEVVIEVAFAGVCATDVAVADGQIAVDAGRVLGHELAGRVRELGEGVTGLVVGAPVTAIPFGRRADGSMWWLGIDCDGGFAEQVRVPASCVVPLPPAMPLVLGTYVEPVAAALAVLPAIARGASVLVAGTGRLAEVAARVLAAHGAVVSRIADGRAYDAVVELEPAQAHASFADAVGWLDTKRIRVDDLAARPQPLSAFGAIFAATRAGDAAGQMFAIAERH